MEERGGVRLLERRAEKKQRERAGMAVGKTTGMSDLERREKDRRKRRWWEKAKIRQLLESERSMRRKEKRRNERGYKKRGGTKREGTRRGGKKSEESKKEADRKGKE